MTNNCAEKHYFAVLNLKLKVLNTIDEMAYFAQNLCIS